MSTANRQLAAGMQPERELLQGWGGTPRSVAEVYRPLVASQLRPAMRCGPPALARGLGRSYGDASLNAGGAVFDMTGIRGVHALDLEGGTITVDAGASIESLLPALLAAGYFVPVTPGTQHVTIGGAIAADIHGKNHHADGSIQQHLLSFDLLLPTGETCTITPDDQPDIFAATAGGLGLTGIITRGTLRLLPVESAYMRVDRERLPNLDATLQRFMDSDDDYRYSVAWLDCLAHGRSLGRSVLMRANHARRDELPADLRDAPLAMKSGLQAGWPVWMPGGMVRGSTVRAFNEAFYRRAPLRRQGAIEGVGPYFYPLDGIANWNRAYGQRGFVQYQFVVPYGQEAALRSIIERIANAGCPSLVTVLKRMGEGHGMLSFPIAGWTLALDFPAATRGLADLLDELDRTVADAGGRVYLAKDARMRPELLPGMYPELERFREVRRRLDPECRFSSDLARRLNLL